MTAILEVKNISVDYVEEDNKPLRAVEGVSFTLERGKSLGLVGESGCGKTTMMLSILRLLPEAGRIVDGQVLFDGKDLLQFSESQMQKIRWKDISIVFQGAMNALNPVRTVESQLVEALRIHDVINNLTMAKRRAAELLEIVGIPGERGRHYPHQFSGGMRQRAMIAMALTCNPRILIADEPTTALDVMIQAQIIELLEKLRDELDLTLVVVTHDLGVVAEMCDEVLVMYGGTLAEYAGSDAIFNEPKHPYTERLLKAFPDIVEPGSELASIPGVPPRLDNLPPGCRFQPRCHVCHDEPRCQVQQPALVEVAPAHYVACHLVDPFTQKAR
ncbi:MAG: ABC transporter ATP-binding protein [Anaerolineaceae bacterium]|nr:ABC transporter ATP-binding protein [Anaerolineaceae bacterium]